MQLLLNNEIYTVSKKSLFSLLKTDKIFSENDRQLLNINFLYYKSTDLLKQLKNWENNDSQRLVRCFWLMNVKINPTARTDSKLFRRTTSVNNLDNTFLNAVLQLAVQRQKKEK